MKQIINTLKLLLLSALFWQASSIDSHAQCISSNPQADVSCSDAPITLTAVLPSNMLGLNASIFWAGSSPQATGDSYVFTPDCADLGEQSFTPCLPSGVTVPSQSFVIGPYSGTIPVGETANETFTVSGICYQEGVSTYAGNLLLSVTGNTNDYLDICITLPSGTPICTGPLNIGTIQGLGGSIPMSLLQLTEAPNGTWSISIANVASSSGSAGYNIAASTIIVPSYTTTTAICADPVEFHVLGNCPSYVSVQANETAACSGETITFSATLDPLDASNVAYMWTGPNGFASTLPNPSVTLTNTTCDPIVETYMLQQLTCTNNNDVITTNQAVTITIYPELTLSDVTIDNTTNIQEPDCSITVAVNCPNFTVNGQIGQNTVAFLPGDNNSQGEFIISNGLSSCDLIVSPPVTCLSNCNPPVAMAAAVCQDADQFNINVSITALGDASSYTIVPSQGAALTINAIGNYTFGPYPNNTSVNIKILNDVEVNCNLNLGNVQQTCKSCPELVTAMASSGTSRCAGDAATFNATVTSGYVLNADYRIQWQLNGVNISGATDLTYTRILSSSDYCAAELQTYTAIITCLNGGTPAAVTTLTAANLSVYNRPRFGQEFTAESCSAMPIDNCNNGLTISNGGADNPSQGDTVSVNYVASISGAPTGCVTTGSFIAFCPNCTEDDAGYATTDKQTVCWGDNFSISSAEALVTKPGFVVGLAVSTQPITSITSTTNLQAQADVAILGPYASPGTINPAEIFSNNNTILPQPTSSCGETYYFTPFLSFKTTLGFMQNTSGVYTAVGDGLGCNGSAPVPGIGGGFNTISGMPFCAGLTTYDIQYCAYNDDAYEINPCFCEILGNPIPNGGITSDFPNINACETGCYEQNNWIQDPNGKSIFTTIAIVPIGPFSCDQVGHVSWDLSVFLHETNNFPTICPSCNSLGESVAVTILPEVTIANITAPDPICTGQSFELTSLNPTPSPATIGAYHWYQGDPNTGAPELTSTLVSPTANTVYCVDMDFCSNGTCRTPAKCFTLTVLEQSSLNNVTPSPICQGSSVDLTEFEDQFTGQSGTFQWFIGNPDASTPPSGAPIADPTNVLPIGSERYYVRYTPDNSCAVTSYLQFGYSLSACTSSVNPCISSNPQADISCSDAPTTLTAVLPDNMLGLGSSIFWAGTSPQATGSSYVFTPNCADLGEQSFTPCLPSGSTIPSQSFVIGPYSGTIPVGGTANETFTVSGICYQEGVSTYLGNLLLSVAGNSSDNLNICITTPSGVQTCTGSISIGTIQGLGGSLPNPLPMFQDPTGTWLISITNVAGNSAIAGYSIAASTITVPSYMTAIAICADPVTFHVLADSSVYVSEANKPTVYSGETIAFSAISPTLATDYVTISGSANKAQDLTIELTDLMGRRLAIYQASVAVGNFTYEMSLNSNAPSGYLLLNIRSYEGIYTTKILRL